MRAAAILAPGVSPRLVEKFRGTDCELEVVNDLNDARRSDAALIFGGDGSVHRQLAVLSAVKLPMLVVPAGSGNDFAHALGIHSIADAVAAWRSFQQVKSNVAEIDLGSIRSASSTTGAFFCNVAGVGLDSAINRCANWMPRWLRSHGGYILAALSTIPIYTSQIMEIEADDGEVTTKLREPAFMVAVANTPSYGGGMRIAPRASAADSKLEVCLVRRTSRLRLLRLFPRVFRGTHLSLREVAYFQAERLKISAEHSSSIFADGEYVCDTPVEITVKPRALRVVTGALSA